MSILSSVGKGFRFFLMSIGVSTYDKKQIPPKTAATAAIPPVKPE